MTTQTSLCERNKTVTLLWMLIASLSFATAASRGLPISLPNCPDRCGNTNIPYPFGTKPGCYFDEDFFIHCDKQSHPPKAFLNGSTLSHVTEIMLPAGELRTWSAVAHMCYDRYGNLNKRVSNSMPLFWLRKFRVSYSKNKFTVVGCDSYAYFAGTGGAKFTEGCMSVCSNLADVINGSCTGNGCCQISAPELARNTTITLGSFKNHTLVSSFDPCSYAFVVEETFYNFTSLDFYNLVKVKMVPMIVDWTIGNQACEEAKKNSTSYACKAKSYCLDSDNGPGYRCNCIQGYEGNPYLPTGCQDIDECKVHQPCNTISKCINLPGSYKCSCPRGYTGDGKKEGAGCIPIPTSSSSVRNILISALGISVVLSILLLASAWGLQQRKFVRMRRKHFQENGGLILQNLLSQLERPIETFRHYTAKDLMKATNNYDESMILGQGGQGTVYKGVLPDEKVVAIKKSNVIDKSQVEQFINEVVILSQINHRNVIKLLGCCLETEVPMLVYEFITNGTLFHHIQRLTNTPPMSWQTRLRIAVEAAGALSYLHSAASIPIIHRDVKTSNILLDDSFTAKVSDFGTSRFAPVDKTSLTTLVQGTFGYLDPEYFYSSQLTEKSDVYSFGVVLLELLTGEKALCFDRPEEERNLAMYFVSSLKEDQLLAIIEGSLKAEVNAWQLNQVAMIAARCLSVRGEERPTMKEVATELEALMKMNMHTWVENDLDSTESESLLNEVALR